MSRPLDRDVLEERLDSEVRDTYIFIGSVNKGIALATASVAVLMILSRPGECAHRLAPWFASLVALLVSHVTWSRGILMTNARANLWDTVWPVIMGLFEIALFAMLLPDDTTPHDLWRQWLVVVGLHSLCAFLLVANRQRMTKIHNFTPALRPLGEEYRRWLDRDKWGALVGGYMSLGLYAVTWVSWTYDWLRTGATLVMAGALCIPIWQASTQRGRIDQYVTSLRGLHGQLRPPRGDSAE